MCTRRCVIPDKVRHDAGKVCALSIGSDPSFVFTANPVYDIICR